MDRLIEQKLAQAQGMQSLPSVGGLHGAAPTITYREQLQSHKCMLTSQLERVDQLIKLLEENPAIEQFMDLSRNF